MTIGNSAFYCSSTNLFYETVCGKIIGKVDLNILRTKMPQVNSLNTYCGFKIKVRELELQAEKYPRAPLEIFEFGFAGAAEPGLLFTNSSNVLKYSYALLSSETN